MSATHLAADISSAVAAFSARGFVNRKGLLPDSDLTATDAFFPVLSERSPGARTDAFTPEARDWLASHENSKRRHGAARGETAQDGGAAHPSR